MILDKEKGILRIGFRSIRFFIGDQRNLFVFFTGKDREMKQHVLKVFRIDDQKVNKNNPVYTLVDGKLFRTTFHPEGWSDLPDYDLHSSGGMYRTVNHPKGPADIPDYEIDKEMRLFRTPNHPDGQQNTPEFMICD